VVTIFARAALEGEPLVIQSAGRRDFTDVHDVARAIGLAVQRTTSGHRVYNIATGVGTTFRELAEQVVVATGSASPIEEQIGEPAGRDLVANIERAQEELSYQPCVELRAGLDRYVEWLRRNSA
jgi:nucleoside-diphosphate-sugar epimerase